MKPLRSGYIQGHPTGGPHVEAFERELEVYYGVSHARAFNSATSAIHAALVAAGVGPADDVLVPAYSMSATAAAIVHAGAQPIFCDIDSDYTLDWADALERITPRTKAAIVVHLFGHHASVPAAFPFPIIHDAAQSASLVPARRVGISGNAARAAAKDCWVYSLNQHKVIQCGEGGYALTFSDDVAARLHLVRNHGESAHPDVIGYNYRLAEPLAGIAREELQHLGERLAARRDWAATLAERYDLPDDDGNIDWHLYPVRITRNREAYAARIIGARVGYQALICDMPYFAERGYSEALPAARRIENEIVVISPEAYDL